MITSLNNLYNAEDKKTTYSSPRTRKHNKILYPKTRLAALFCVAVQIRICITIEAVFVALVGSTEDHNKMCPFLVSNWFRSHWFLIYNVFNNAFCRGQKAKLQGE